MHVVFSQEVCGGFFQQLDTNVVGLLNNLLIMKLCTAKSANDKPLVITLTHSCFLWILVVLDFLSALSESIHSILTTTLAPLLCKWGDRFSEEKGFRVMLSVRGQSWHPGESAVTCCAVICQFHILLGMSLKGQNSKEDMKGDIPFSTVRDWSLFALFCSRDSLEMTNFCSFWICFTKSIITLS